MGKIYRFTRKELKEHKASEFEHGDHIIVSHWRIYIRYWDDKNIYARPSLLSWVEERNTDKLIGSTPGADRPYYIDDFTLIS